ncbi:hypothetical protein SN16_01795 [Salinicoccus roseus]|nr:hypothetical protein SN16_01795 [Salinicoccus roseus]
MKYEEVLVELKNFLYKGRKSVRNSDLAIQNKFIFHSKLDEVAFESEIDWNYKHPHSHNTYQLYMHTLNIVGNLTASYLDTNDENYIEKAHSIIISWVNTEDNQYIANINSSWKDHSVSSRIKNLILYQLSAPESLKMSKAVFNAQLKSHGDFLSDRKNYSENNHGMMSDEALLLLSYFMDDEKIGDRFKELAVLRMERMVYKLFSSMSMNLENSPEYHKVTQVLSAKFIDLTKIIGVDFDSRCKEIIIKSEYINSLIIQPDKTYPLIGDTGYRKLKINKVYDNLIDYQAGLAIINTRTEAEADSSWLSFKSGYVSTSHKHLDDLSINYVHNGESILVDSGKYNYDGRDPMKQYMKSPSAHSTIFLKDGEYSLNNAVDDAKCMRLKFVQETKEYVHLAGINHLYDKMKIWRDIIYFESRGMIIIDRYITDSSKVMSQNFNYHEKLNINKIDGKSYMIQTPKGKELIIKEMTARTISRYYSHENKERGFISRDFGKYIETQQIEYLKKSYKNQYITLLYEPELMNIDGIEEKEGLLNFIVDGKEISVRLQRTDNYTD